MLAQITHNAANSLPKFNLIPFKKVLILWKNKLIP